MTATTKTALTGNGIPQLLELNRVRAEAFVRGDFERLQYAYKHPTAIAALKCMDGRWHLPRLAGIPLGFITPFRNVGGIFDPGWHAFALSINNWAVSNIVHKRNCVLFTTYHYSESQTHLGCRGFGYNKKAAVQYSANLRDELDICLGEPAVFVIQLGLETDTDALIFHSKDGKVLDLRSALNLKKQEVRERLKTLYPNLPKEALNDVLRIATGNIKRIKEVADLKQANIAIDHEEWVLAIGGGIDWLHEINMALILNPLNPKLGDAIVTAGKILMENWEQGRVKHPHEPVLMTSIGYHTRPWFGSMSKRQAIQVARNLKEHALDKLQTELPQLSKILTATAMVVNMDSWLAEQVD